MKRCLASFARVSGVAWNPPKEDVLARRSGDRKGAIRVVAGSAQHDEHDARMALNRVMHDNDFLSNNRVPQRKLVNLPGVAFASDLPADPITRLFFQTSGEHALYRGNYVHPSEQDSDRLQIARRDAPIKHQHLQQKNPVYDFCHRIREGCDQRKRFVIVPSTFETRGCAQVLLKHGLVSGFRDFHNDRAFAVELKYFQNEPTIMTIVPSSVDAKQEFEWSPKMMRRLMNSHGIHNRIQIYICRTADGRVIDHIQATKEQIGGRGLMMCA